MSRTQNIRDNLEVKKKEMEMFKLDGVTYHTTKMENIKEAESMIDELETIGMDLAETLASYSEGEFRRTAQEESNEETLKMIIKKKQDWQNLLNWLRGLK